VSGGVQVVVGALQGQRVGRHVPHFGAFARDAQVGHALATLEVAHAQAAQFLAAQPVVEEGRQDGPIALAFEGVGRGRVQERPGLAVAQSRGFAFVAFGLGAFDAAHRVVADRVHLAEVVEERSHRGELSADGTGRQAAALEVFKARRSGGRG
jgi:hypothetical protein